MSRAPLDGVIVVDKPVGPTSHDVVARLRRASGCRRVGHTGTLDPLASGVLPLVLGRATRLARFFSGSDKTYEAVLQLGVETDTYDSQGRPGQAVPVASLPAPDAIAEAAHAFVGDIQQVPPPFSAKKVAGRPAYEYARRDMPLALAPVGVSLRALEVLGQERGLVRLRLRCSAGFYVRSLAHDLGAALGCGAHLVELRRTRSGDFGIEAAVPLDRLDDAGAVERALLPLDSLLPGMPAARLTAAGAERASHGQPLGPEHVAGFAGGPPPPAGGPVRLIDEEGRLLGVADARAWAAPTPALHPAIVLV